ncbi:EcoAI/FtnUII family type I restriction enzme subunit R [Verminephrobacter eiseniae]|uniref:EcoAI/FtnUII family type I restriction enzme subunit R n=1 Tax=Verminephrobacter eiseniae TaxID=364317 RepID=UPI002237954E|nr:DEAD/DEAH box helicase family protein [Verminephrobacter eiseniae]MCW5233861.1 restriction endonuclease [Verminephrobacter eiseniae]MCW5294583.1 restriction endonuclease [Verminephrobacter eiseniae]MCW8184858.1 restriction endonuclease [Verminephrobacter eiseniae]MCW8223604.1 restriction endonuclease [Verminephrobacter eiseniae]MCW8234652.1 restriction endonuclease [Verminephrobacter eiseniae]
MSNLRKNDICDKLIRPAMEKAGWSSMDQIYRAYPLRPGQVMVCGNEARRDSSTELRADFVLFYKANIPLAVVQASQHMAGEGLLPAIDCARLLDAPFCFAGNGDGLVLRDATRADAAPERQLTLDEFPSPAELWDRYCAARGWSPQVCQVAASDYAPGKTLRYYQLKAINRTVEAIANGQNRALLVMAAGTGKTSTAFQIIWRLWKSDSRKRILFLADSNTLINQAMVNDFRPFKSAMIKLSFDAKGVERADAPGERKWGDRKTAKEVDKSYEIYLASCRIVTGTGEKHNDIYKQFRPDFFDLIVVDECHHGSAAEDSVWREILDYFASATQIGFSSTAVDSDYFGAPIYSYSFRQGIKDGYLAPYKIIRVDLERDTLTGHTMANLTDPYGLLIENYASSVLLHKPVPEQRDLAAAARITEYLQATDRYAKTIVFCENTDHATRMRQALTQANADLCATEPGYVVQIAGDNADDKHELENFINPEKTFPVIITSSKLTSTGIDAATCKLIVIDRNIPSMAQFEQIIGWGSRLHEDLGKSWFTIIDFRRATELFADKDLDGGPVQVYEPKAGEPMEPSAALIDPLELPDQTPPGGTPEAPASPWCAENLRGDIRSKLLKRFDSLAQFLQTWQQAERKTTLLQELQAYGIPLNALAAQVVAADTGLQNLDPFDLLLHVAYDQPTLTRRERAARVKKRKPFSSYGPMARKVLQALLDKYADEGITTIESSEVFRIQPFTNLGSPVELVRSFGGRPQYQAALQTLVREIYRAG